MEFKLTYGKIVSLTHNSSENQLLTQNPMVTLNQAMVRKGRMNVQEKKL